MSNNDRMYLTSDAEMKRPTDVVSPPNRSHDAVRVLGHHYHLRGGC